MDFGSIVQSAYSQLLIISKAPVPFLTAVAFVSWAIWQAMKYSYDTRLVNAESTKELMERQLQEYKDKLSGASPDEAKARMDALEAKLDSLSPRTLDIDAKNRMLMVLSSQPGRQISIAYDAAVRDAKIYCLSLTAAFREAKWQVINSTILGVGNPPITGIIVNVSDPNNLTQAQQAMCNALQAAGIQFDLRAAPRPIERMTVEAEIVVTEPLP